PVARLIREVAVPIGPHRIVQSAGSPLTQEPLYETCANLIAVLHIDFLERGAIAWTIRVELPPIGAETVELACVEQLDKKRTVLPRIESLHAHSKTSTGLGQAVINGFVKEDLPRVDIQLERVQVDVLVRLLYIAERSGVVFPAELEGFWIEK